MDNLHDAGAAAEIAMPLDGGFDAVETLLAEDASAALALLSAQADASADEYARRDGGEVMSGHEPHAFHGEAEARNAAEGSDSSDLRLDVVMAEVAAVLALIAQDYTSNDGRARPYALPRYPVRPPLKSADIRRLPIAAVQPARSREVNGPCTIIAFPGPAARPVR